MSELIYNAAGTVAFVGVCAILAAPLIIGMEAIAKWRKW